MTDPICPAGTLPRPDPRLWLGCTVTMETDRPIGYTHTKNGHTFTYPINYGYIPGVTGGDGEELDVYLLGVDRPVRCQSLTPAMYPTVDTSRAGRGRRKYAHQLLFSEMLPTLISVYTP